MANNSITIKSIAPSTPLGEMRDDSLLNQFKKKTEAKNLVAWVRAEYEKCKSARKQEEQEWYLQLSFYNGYQYHSWKNIGKQQVLSEEPNPQNLPRVTVPRIVTGKQIGRAHV